MSLRALLAVAVGATLGLAACPGLADLDVKITTPREAGHPFVLEARLTLRSALRASASASAILAPPLGFSGRAQLGVRTPPGWRVSGRYRLGERDYALMRAPMVKAAYDKAAPVVPAARWHGFVSHLHTDHSPDAAIEVTLVVTPPGDAPREPTEIAVGAGPAPHYPQWRSALTPRVLRLAF